MRTLTKPTTWLTANSSAIPLGASSPAASFVSSWTRKRLSIHACSMACYTVHCLGWGTFHRHVRTQRSLPTSHRLGCPRLSVLLLHRALLHCSAHQGTNVMERVNCLWGSKSRLTGSVVRLKILPHPLGVSHWVLKTLGCLIAWQCQCESNQPETEKATHECVRTGTNSCSYPKSESAGSLACWATFMTHWEWCG